MDEMLTRRGALKRIAASSDGLAFAGRIRAQAAPIIVAGRPVEIAIWSLGPTTVRIAVSPVQQGRVEAVPFTAALVEDEPGVQSRAGVDTQDVARVQAGDVVVRFTDTPPTLHVETPVLVRLAGSDAVRTVRFTGDPLDLPL